MQKKSRVWLSPGLVDFANGQMKTVLNLRNWQVKFFEEFKLKFKLQKLKWCLAS